MQHNLLSDLTTYDLPPEEELHSSVLSVGQQAVIQNLRVEIIRQLAFLSPIDMTPEQQQAFWQQEAYLRGQHDILMNLMERHTAAQQALSPSNDSDL